LENVRFKRGYLKKNRKKQKTRQLKVFLNHFGNARLSLFPKKLLFGMLISTVPDATITVNVADSAGFRLILCS